MADFGASPAAALELGPTLPNTFVGTIDHLAIGWAKYTAQPGDTGISFFAYGATSALFCAVYDGLAAANAQFPVYLGISDSTCNRPLWFPVTPGNEYYIELDTDGAASYDFDVRVLRVPDLSVAVGDLVVPDSKEGLPVVFRSGVDGATLRIIQPYATGEVSQVLTNGWSMSEDVYVQRANIYDDQFVLQTAVAIPGWASGHMAGGTNKTDAFYVKAFGSAVVYKLDTAGNFDATTWTLSGTDGFSLFPSNDESILYWVDSTYTIKRHDLLTDTPLTDLATIPAGFDFGGTDIFVLDDGRIVTFYEQLAGAQRVVFYNPDGSIDLQVDFSYPLGNSGHRLALGVDNQTDVVFWIHPATGFANSIFIWINTTSGVTSLLLIDLATFITGVYMGAPTATPLGDYGHPESCAFFIARAAIGPPPPPGCPGEVTGPRQDGLPYAPAPAVPCDGDGTVSGARIGT